MMKTPVVLVAVALTVAILLTASLLIATGTRGEEGKVVIGELHAHHLTMSSPAKAGDRYSRDADNAGRIRPVDKSGCHGRVTKQG
jgi:hypothetical protein